MRTKCLLLIVSGLLSLVTMQAMPIAHHDIPEQIELLDIPPDMTEIILQGSLINYTGPNSVEAYLCKHAVAVSFHQNLGEVSITVVGETGNMIYSGTVNTAVQQIVYIPIEGAPDGNYIITLENYVSMAEGEFEK